MKTNVKHIPEGSHAVNPYIMVNQAAEAIEFYKKAFGAQERYRLPMPDGRVGHAELMFGDSLVMLSDEFPDYDNLSPTTLKGSPVILTFYVENVDEVFARAIKAGAKEKEAVKDQFWGDRSGTLIDPFGHKWMVMTHVEDVSADEIKNRMAKMMEDVAGQKQEET